MKIIVKKCSFDMQKIFYPADITSGVICGGGQKSVVRGAELSSKIMDGFFRKTKSDPYYWGWWLQILKIP